MYILYAKDNKFYSIITAQYNSKSI